MGLIYKRIMKSYYGFNMMSKEDKIRLMDEAWDEEIFIMIERRKKKKLLKEQKSKEDKEIVFDLLTDLVLEKGITKYILDLKQTMEDIDINKYKDSYLKYSIFRLRHREYMKCADKKLKNLNKLIKNSIKEGLDHGDVLDTYYLGSDKYNQIGGYIIGNIYKTEKMRLKMIKYKKELNEEQIKETGKYFNRKDFKNKRKIGYEKRYY